MTRLTLGTRRARWIAVTLATVLVSACHGGPGWPMMGGGGWGSGPMGGIGWGRHAFTSNGERIYFTATSERGTRIEPHGGPAGGGWMMMHGRLACVSCHGIDGRGGRRGMGPMATMEAKDIRWSTLSKEFDEAQFAVLVREGREPDGKMLEPDMPRWEIDDADVADLVAYLKTLR